MIILSLLLLLLSLSSSLRSSLTIIKNRMKLRRHSVCSSSKHQENCSCSVLERGKNEKLMSSPSKMRTKTRTTRQRRRRFNASSYNILCLRFSSAALLLLSLNFSLCSEAFSPLSSRNSRRREPYAPGFQFRGVSPIDRHQNLIIPLFATSSSDLKHKRRRERSNDSSDSDNQPKGGSKSGDKKSGSTSAKSQPRRRNIVARLSHAAKQANERRIREEEEEEEKQRQLQENEDHDLESTSSQRQSSSSENLGKPSLFGNNRRPPGETNEEQEPNGSSITDLFSIIDQELSSPTRPTDINSMMQLLEFNDRVEVATRAMQAKVLEQQASDAGVLDEEEMSDDHSDEDATEEDECNSDILKSNLQNATNHVAIVLSKPLVRDAHGTLQLSLEYATRFQTLAKTLQNGYRPKLICICGNTNSHTKTEPIVSEVSMGVVYFQHLCAAQNISLSGVSMAIVPFDGRRSLQGVADVIQQYHLTKWWDDSTLFERKTDEYGLLRREPRKKVHIHMTVFSTDYQLCQLYDIHTRSPRKSPFQTLRVIPRRGGIVDTGFSFQYASYPYTQSLSEDPSVAFLGNCYKLAQTVVPLLVNIQGVAEYMEFFQRDNYRALVSTRRSLLTLLEDMNAAYTEYAYQEKHNLLLQLQTDDDEDRPGILNSQVSLKTQLQSMMVPDDTQAGGVVSVDVALESAVLALGRCLDLVRPAGVQAAQSVPKEDWQQAAEQLEWFLDRMNKICDPDVPLPAQEWGKLSFRGNNENGKEDEKDQILVDNEYEPSLPTTTFYCTDDDDFGNTLSQQLDDEEESGRGGVLQDEDEDGDYEMLDPLLDEWKGKLQSNQVYKSFKELDRAFDREENDPDTNSMIG